MQLNEQEKARTVQQLADMFTTRSEQQVRRLCEELDWNVQRCVDLLICETMPPNSTSKTVDATTTTAAAQTQVENTITIEGDDANDDTNLRYLPEKCQIQQNGAVPKSNKPNNSKNNKHNNVSNYSVVSSNEASSKNLQSRKLTTTASPNKIRNSKYSPSSNLNQNANNGMKAINDNGAAAASRVHQRICAHINSGHRVLVIMRGAPGSGKSTLAQSLLKASLPLNNAKDNYSEFIFSSDDYFYDTAGRYSFNPQMLVEAHAWNQKRVRDKARAGWSPIFVDNTNIRLWEMMPYVELAVQNGYLIELLEPNTSWRQSASKLAIKNKHQVPRESIQRALDNYEIATVPNLVRMLKNTRYSVPLPQMRLQPALSAQFAQPLTTSLCEPLSMPPSEITCEPVNVEVSNKEEQEPIENDLVHQLDALDIQRAPVNVEVPVKQKMQNHWSQIPKEQRITNKKTINVECNAAEEERDAGFGIKNSVSHENIERQGWQPYEQEAYNYWGQQQQCQSKRQESSAVNEATNNSSKKSLLDLLRESVNETQFLAEPEKCKETVASTTGACSTATTMRRHAINCPNESSAFTALRQIYPNKRATGLWDLFVKCGGDVDWAVDILLKEDELAVNNEEVDLAATVEEGLDDFTCDCAANLLLTPSHEPTTAANVDHPTVTIMPAMPAKPQRQPRSRRTNPEMREMQLQIEHCFVLGDELYSAHTRKIRDIRNGALDAPILSPVKLMPADQTEQNALLMEATLPADVGLNGNDDEDDEPNVVETDGNQLLEIELGEKLVQQLCSVFHTETTLGERLPEQYATNIFIPRAMAKQLHMLWLETVYNQVEEQKQQTLRDDEQFARLLKNPKYSDVQVTPDNVHELLDMELAWSIYNDDKQRHSEYLAEPTKPNDIATHLTKMKLCELFPDIPRETLLDVYAAQGHSYSQTLQTLGINEQASASDEVTQDELIERAKREHERLNQQAEQEVQQQQQQLKQQTADSEDVDNNLLMTAKTTQLQEERKRLALHDFEKTRNMAAHHAQLKAECYQRAKEAIQKGNGGAAIYYSEIANLHKRKIDMYNHRAANCIMEVHRYTQNNPDLLDLHYLHVLEAISCLDLFLDQHITTLRSLFRPYKHVFIITGRGLHSAGGVSTIKNKVKQRLKERGLKWNDVNPGLLKVKIFSASRHANNFF